MADLNWLLNVPIAHRGYHFLDKGVCENSISAFNNAIEKGYNIETDVHMLKDGTLVIFHDKSLERVCGVKGNVTDLTLDKISEYKLGGTEDTIITFDEFLKLIDGKVGLLIEIKAPYMYPTNAYAEKIAKTLDNYKGNFAIQSFSPHTMKWFAKNRPDWAHGMLLFSHFYFFKKAIKADFLACSYKLCKEKWSNDVHNKGKKLLYWTIRNDEQYKQAKKYADNIIFEHLDL